MAHARSTPLRIGCCSAFWGDTETAAAQLIRHGDIDYLVADYLAEITLSIMAGQKLKDPSQGYARDFVQTIAPLLSDIRDRGIRVLANAGGVNPVACRDALQTLCDRAGVPLRIALVLGDDVLPQARDLRAGDIREMTTDQPLPDRLVSLNAYLGAPGLVAALERGADIVVTGRSRTAPWCWRRWCTNSAGPGRTMTGWPRAAWPVTCWNAGPRSPAATSRTGARCATATPTWVFRSLRSIRTAVLPSPSQRVPAAGSAAAPWPSSWCTRLATPAPICCRTSPAISRL